MEELQLEILPKGMLNELRGQYNLEDQIHKAQQECLKIQEIQELMELGKCPEFREDEQGVYWYKDRIYVPSDAALCRRNMVGSLPRGMPKVVDYRQTGAQATNEMVTQDRHKVLSRFGRREA